jgi:soluble lytic murein transglycosylase-like protein
MLIRDDTATVTFEMEGAGTWTLARGSLLRIDKEEPGEYWLRVGERHARKNRFDRARNAFVRASADPDTSSRAQRRLKDLDQLDPQAAARSYTLPKIETSQLTLAAKNEKTVEIPSLPLSKAKVEAASAPGGSLPPAKPKSPTSRETQPAPEPAFASSESTGISDLIRKYARQYGVDPLLVRAIISVESEWDPRATSSSGAMGLMQLMPETAALMGVRNAYDPEQNIRGGSKYLGKLYEEFEHLEWEERKVVVIAAYHAGPTRIRDVGDYRLIPATNRYTQKVASAYDRLRRMKEQEVAFLGRASQNFD